ncbi:MAG: hypothetical protein LCH73_04450 [Proteobacteria bacterium]|nr:hypothetical protein [Pseudomonadota bacterium]
MAVEIDCAFVKNVRFSSIDWPPSKGLPSDSATYFSSPVTIHQLVPGSGTALVFRSFLDGNPETHDAAQYWKVTIMLPDLGAGRRYSAPLADWSARASRGGSAWLGNGSGFVSTQSSGHVKADWMSSDELNINLVAGFVTQLVADPTIASQLRLVGKFKLQGLRADELTPWMGAVAGSNDRRLTYRVGEPSARCNWFIEEAPLLGGIIPR